MKHSAHTLYWQIAGLYAVLLVGFSVLAILVALHQFDGFIGEVEQRLNRGLAERLVKDLTPALARDTPERLTATVKAIAQINPSIDLYLLDGSGSVRTSLTGKSPIRTHVEVNRISAFITKDAMLPIRATDPGSASGEKVFSAARIPDAVGGGFLYVVLPGMPFETTAHLVRSSYIVRGAGLVLGAVLFTTLVAGLALVFMLTRRFQRLTQSVRRFQEGAFDERADAGPRDQIGRLAASFNEMAATIEAQFRALKATDAARQAFATNISHDFRTPLTVLRGYTSRMLRAGDRLSDDERRQHLDAVLRSAAHLEHLAEQLAMMVYLDGGNQLVAKREPFSIAELVQDSTLKLALLAEQVGVTLTIVNPEHVPPVLGDIAMIERVLANLLENAIGNTDRGGAIRIYLPVVGRRVQVRIEDTGCGIAAEEIPLLKQRFYRTQASRRAGRQGTGLGLAIADEIIEKHGSTLTIESEVGAGSCVAFFLDLA